MSDESDRPPQTPGRSRAAAGSPLPDRSPRDIPLGWQLRSLAENSARPAPPLLPALPPEVHSTRWVTPRAPVRSSHRRWHAAAPDEMALTRSFILPSMNSFRKTNSTRHGQLSDILPR